MCLTTNNFTLPSSPLPVPPPPTLDFFSKDIIQVECMLYEKSLA